MKWLLFILCAFFLFGYSDAMGEEWKLFSESEGSSFFFDAESVSFLPENVVRVWVKVVVSEKDRSAWVEKGGERYLKLRYIKSLLEINCKDKSERTLSVESFSEQEILDSFKWEEARGSPISPGSNWDNLHSAICK